jgi:hypothetical protein
LRLTVNQTEELAVLYSQGNIPLSAAMLLVWEAPQLSMPPFPLQSAQLALNNPNTSRKNSNNIKQFFKTHYQTSLQIWPKYN